MFADYGSFGSWSLFSFIHSFIHTLPYLTSPFITLHNARNCVGPESYLRSRKGVEAT